MIHLKKFSVCTVSGAPNENIVQNHLNIALFVKRILVFNNIHEKISRLWLAKRNAVFW